MQSVTFSKKLFISVISLFLVFTTCFVVYQYQREKEYKVQLLDLRLQDYNDRLHLELSEQPDSLWHHVVTHYVNTYRSKDIRITLLSLDGEVIFDSSAKSDSPFSNHLERPEVKNAVRHGHGFDIRRISETTGESYFYSATRYDSLLIRSALPYTPNLIKSLSVDPGYIIVTTLLSLILAFIFYKYTVNLGTAVSKLKDFAKRADRNDPIDMDIQNLPSNELGEISRHIIQIYKRVRETKEALYIEREKLITHLQSSREGLGVFTREKKEILVNNLFTQYANLISDSNLQTTEEIFTVTEFKPVTDFINKTLARNIYNEEERRMSLNISKNGRIFIVECIIFQDNSFEISINDITFEEEQVRLKRQLTQNIAHELKTPVSSIQGYLETIVNNENIAHDKMMVFLERCYAQSNRLSRLLRDISVLTRMDEAANMIEMEKVDISLMVTNIINETQLELEEKHITVVNALRPKIQMKGNYSLLYSIFRNLMDNAIAYAGEHIRINISCFREDDNFYYFSFADTGVGVSPEHLNRIFERFYRVDKGRSRKLGGTGLGLAIVKNAVLIHGGTISGKNNVGGGLEFVFTLAKDKA